MQVEFIEYDSHYYQDCRDLIDESFGEGYANSKNFEDENLRIWLAKEKSTIIGFASLLIKDDVGLLDLIVLKEDYRNKGIGRQLFEKRLSFAKANNLKKVRIKHWVRDKFPKPFVAEEYGFQLKELKRNYWGTESKALAYKCCECKSIPCVCDCAIYEKVL